MERVKIMDARAQLADISNRVHYRRERVVFTRYGRDFVAIVSPEDLALIEMIEDRVDLDEARKALAESDDRIPFDELCSRLHLS